MYRDNSFGELVGIVVISAVLTIGIIGLAASITQTYTYDFPDSVETVVENCGEESVGKYTFNHREFLDCLYDNGYTLSINGDEIVPITVTPNP